MANAIHSSACIWSKASQPHQYVCFRKGFSLPRLDKKGGAVVEIAADSDFILWVNGQEAGRGQFSDWPQRKTFTILKVGHLLREGENILCVLAYHRGEHFSEHCAGRAGLMAALVCKGVDIKTNRAWRCLEHPAFHSSPMPRVTGQMGFTTEFDARKDLAWLDEGFDDSTWPCASEAANSADSYWQELLPRPVPPLAIGSPLPVTVRMQGDFIRQAESGNTAKTMMQDALISRTMWDVFSRPEDYPKAYTPRTPTPTSMLNEGKGLEIAPPVAGCSGRFLVVDVGREEVGLLRLCLDAPAGTVVDIGHGEHLDDGRVRIAVGGRNFADRYICREGAQEYILPFRRLGGRYIELHLSNFSRAIKLSYIGLMPTELKVKVDGAFACGDASAEKVHAISVRTLQLCMHEHYEDCPWREQSLYAYDSRNQALYGYYAFGNYSFAAASFDLLGRGLRPETNLLELCAPANISGKDGVQFTIPLFSLAWMVAVAENWLYSGKPALFKQFRAQIGSMMKSFLDRYDEATGLYHEPAGEGMWPFYEWEEGLDGYGSSAAGRLCAPFNIYLYEALGGYAWMLRQSGDGYEAKMIEATRQVLGKAIHKNFWDERKRAYASFLLKGKLNHYAELTQALALVQGIAPAGKAKGAAAALMGGKLVPMTLSSRIYQAMSLMPFSKEGRTSMAETIADMWGRMATAGTTSFWETLNGSADFDDAGSLCHGWSALPVYYYQAWVLGVRPLEPGFKRFVINPYAADFREASGKVPTPAGAISIAWQRSGKGLLVEANGPRSLMPTAVSFPECPLAQVVYNGKKVKVGKAW